MIEGGGSGASRALDLGCGRGEDGFNAVGPVTCENEGKNVVSLWPSLGTRTNPAAPSEAEFLTQLCGRGWGTRRVDRAQVLPHKRLLCPYTRALSPELHRN